MPASADAERRLRHAVAGNPADAPALRQWALHCMRTGRPTEAEWACAAALSLNPGDPESVAALGMLRMRQGRSTEAESLFRRALAKRADLPVAQGSLAQLLSQRGSPQHAMRAARHALALRPDLATVQSLVGVLLRRLDRTPAEAVTAFQRALRLNPERAESSVHLTDTLAAMGRVGDTAHRCRQGLAYDPGNLPLWMTLGNVQQIRGDTVAALAAYRRAVVLDGTVAAAFVGTAKLLRDQCRWTEAADTLRRAVALDPANLDTLGTLALIHAVADLNTDAERVAQRALRLVPASVAAHRCLREVLQIANRHDEAREVARALVALIPERADSHAELGCALLRSGQPDQARAALRNALTLQPDHVPGLVTLADLYREQGQLADAEATAKRALRLAPRAPEALNNLGLIHYRQQRFADAEAALRAAVGEQPDCGQWHNNLGIVLLTRGDAECGFPELEWRWNNHAFHIHRRDFTCPSLSAERPVGRIDELRLEPGRTLLLWGEQGIGDEIIYAGLVPAVAALGTRCVLECAPRLVPLFARSLRGVEVVARRDPPDPRTLAPDIAFHCPTGSLGRWLLRQRLLSSPEHAAPATGYLMADPELVVQLRARYRKRGARAVVGISWRSKGLIGGARKSTPLTAWDPILSLPGVTFVNLQYGDSTDELAAARRRLGVELVDDPEVDQLKDMDTFAAQVAAMDLVLTTSNTTAHMAGALGVPVWTLLPAEPLLWYWFTGREDSPWYPSMRLMRQDAGGKWDSLLDRTAAAFGAWLDSRPGAES